MSQALVCSAAVEPQRPTFSLAGAGSVLIGFTAAVIAVGTLLGWAVGNLKLGLALRRSPRHPRRGRSNRDQVPQRLMPATWTQPRAAPPTLLPAAAGAIVIAVALPIFLIAGWPLAGWAIGAVLWVGSEALGWVLTRLQGRTGNLAAAGVVAFGMLFRAIAVMVVVFALAVSDKWLGLAAALTYAAGYSAALGLQLVAYYTGPKAGVAQQ